MTKWTDVKDDPNFKKILDHGFVGLVEHSGSDEKICKAARVSYGAGTKTVRENRGLIRYLMSHQHMSPFEMPDITFHLKIPIFVMRQLVRHRTASLNEYSARYSELSDEFYLPDIENIKPQSKTNNQGRSGELSEDDAYMAHKLMGTAFEYSYATYQALLGKDGDIDAGWSDEFPEEGIARELARTVMPVSGYTEVFFKQDLRCLLHMIALRADSHAQHEIQVMANAMYELIKPLYPATCEAYEDYVRDGMKLSSMDKNLMEEVIKISNLKNISFADAYKDISSRYDTETVFIDQFRMSKRELTEFKKTFKLI
jgi:thymidylate synthase (FAD)